MGDAKQEKYLRDCAKTFQGQLGLKAEQFKGHKTFKDIKAALETRMSTITVRLAFAPDEQVGRLACIVDDGLVRQLAAQALISAMARKIWAENNPKRGIKCRFCDFTAAKFAHGRPGDAFSEMRAHIDREHPDQADQIATAAYGSPEDRDIADMETLADEE